jgi:hypothetical protein
MELEQEPSYVDHGLRRLFWWTYIAGFLGFCGLVTWGVL